MNKQIHITFNDSHGGFLLTRFPDSTCPKAEYRSYFLRLILDRGDISFPPFSNGNQYNHMYTRPEEISIKNESQLDEIYEYGEDEVDVYLWRMKNHTDAYMSMLFYAHEFKKFKNLYVVDVYPKGDPEFNFLEPKEALKNKIKLTPDDIDAMTKEYERIKAAGGYFRVTTDEKTQTFERDEFNDLFLDFIPTENYKALNVTDMDVRVHMIKEFGYSLAYGQSCDIMLNLCRKNFIQPQEEFGLAERAEMLIRSRFKKTAGETNPSIDEILSSVCQAFDFGQTTKLYRYMAADAEYHSLIKGISREGREEVIDYIEDIIIQLNDHQMYVMSKIADIKSDKPGTYYIEMQYSDSKKIDLVEVIIEEQKVKKISIMKP